MKRLLFITITVLFSSSANAATTTEQHASFDHSRLSASAQCVRCHRDDQPDDKVHTANRLANCSTCHTTRQWRPTITEP